MLRFLSALTILACIMTSARVRAAQPSMIALAYTAGVDELTLDKWIGIMSAQHEANSANTIGNGFLLNVSYVPGLSTLNTTTEYIVSISKNLLFGRSNYFGFLMPDYINSDALFLIMQKFNVNKPIFGPDAVSNYMSTPVGYNVMNYKVPARVEGYQTFRYALHSDMHCTYFILFRIDYNGTDEVSNEMAETMSAIGMRTVEYVTPTQVPGADPTWNPLNRSAIREYYFRDPEDVPSCVLIIGASSNLVDVVEALWEDERFDRVNTYFLGNSAAMRLVFNSSKFGTAAFSNLYVSLNFDDNKNTSIPSVMSHRRAVNNFFATNPTIPKVLQDTRVTPFDQSSYYSYEAYMTTRLAIEAIKASIIANNGLLAASHVIKTPYQSTFFQINETLAGPYSDHCRSGFAFPCFCNSGNRILYSYRVDGATGLAVPVTRFFHEDPSVTFAAINIDSCTLERSSVAAPLNILIPVKNMATTSFADFSGGLRAAAHAVNDNDVLAGIGKLRPIFVDITNAVTAGNATTLKSHFSKLTRRYLPLAVFGNEEFAAFSGLPSFLDHYSQLPLTDPPISPIAEFNPYLLQLLPVVADYIHLQSKFIAYTVSNSSLDRPVFVFAETEKQGQLAEASLNSFGLLRRTILVAKHLGTGGQSVFDNLFASSAAASLLPLLLVVGENETLVSVVLSRLSRSAMAYPENKVPVFLACDEQFVYNYMTNPPTVGTGAAIALPSTLELYIASSLPNWWKGNTSQSPSVSRTNEAVAALVSALRTLQNGRGPQKLVEIVYILKTLYAGNATFGPFYDAPCDEATTRLQKVARTCQCTKGPRDFYAYDSRADSSSLLRGGNAAVFKYSMETCGVLYIPLPTSASSSISTSALIGISVAGGFVLLLSLCLMVIFCSARFLTRDNKNAPKDGLNVTIVFTDIQSSTLLWARLPQSMTLCVNLHHAVIRRCSRMHHGYEVKTVGDSFMVAFEDPCDATACAMDIQDELMKEQWPDDVDSTYLELEQEQASFMESNIGEQLTGAAAYASCWHGLRVRVGINTGPCDVVLDEVTKGYDYYGTTVNTAARVEAVGHGGQVLMTAATYDALCHAHFDFSTVVVKEHGPVPLRGLDECIALFTVLPASLQSRRFKPLRLQIESQLVEEIQEDQRSPPGSHDTSQQVDDAMERFAKRLHGGSFSSKIFIDRMTFFETVFSTCPVSYQREVVGFLKKQWGIEAQARQAGDSKDHCYASELVALVAKMSAAALVKQKKCRSNATTPTSSQGSSSPCGR